MTLIEWTDFFRTGIEPVDAEHRELITLINSLHDSMRAQASHEDVLAALREIHLRIAEHFASEEALMRKARYRGLPQHRLDHETLLDEIVDIIESIEEDDSYAEQELSQSLKRWFADHFRTYDAKLHEELGH